MSKKLANGSSRAEKHKTLFDNHLTKIEEFNANKKLTVANYDTLLATAQTAQAQAQAWTIDDVPARWRDEVQAMLEGRTQDNGN